MMNSQNPYIVPEKPKGYWQLVQWVFNEPTHLKNYSVTLSKKESVITFLQVYWRFMVLIVTPVYLLSTFLISFFDVPVLIPGQFTSSFLTDWEALANWPDRFLFLINLTISSLAFILFGSLAFGLGISLAGGLAYGLAYSLVFGLAFGLGISLAGGLAYGLVLGLTVGLARGLAVGLAYGLAFYVAVFRLYSYLPKLLSGIFLKTSFQKNAYTQSEINLIPVYTLEHKLKQQAKEQPEKARPFIEFLLKYRKFQHGFAMQLQHITLATCWENTSVAPEHFKANEAVFETPAFSKQKKKLLPSKEWQEMALLLGKQLQAAQQETNSLSRRDNYQLFVTTLTKFYQLHLRENTTWTKYYKDVFPKWQKEAQEVLGQLKELTKGSVRNPYQRGDELYPNQDEAVFMGRNEQKELFEHEIRNARQLPMFLLHGQRRVGKSSLLNFLSKILGRGYTVVEQNMQEGTIKNLKDWMKQLRTAVNKKLGLTENTNWQPGDNWLQSWDELSTYLLEVCTKVNTKLVIALDEYEDLHTKAIAKDPEQGGYLLGAMRSFSQSQRQIVFLFTGVNLFSELEKPRWSDYFPHAKYIYVDYLSKEDSIKLLSRPYEDFPLVYEEGTLEYIYEETQGHPQLLQTIGDVLVNYCNYERTHQISRKILEAKIEHEILINAPGAFDVFWTEFCEQQEMKDTVIAIIEQKTPQNKASLIKLLEHKFIVKKDGRFQMRVPLFEKWVRKNIIDLLKFE
jgi:uncharacterized membrane protein YedE/YeeE